MGLLSRSRERVGTRHRKWLKDNKKSVKTHFRALKTRIHELSA